MRWLTHHRRRRRPQGQLQRRGGSAMQMVASLALLLLCASFASAQSEASSTTSGGVTNTPSSSSSISSVLSSSSLRNNGSAQVATPLLTTETVKQGGSSVLTTATLPTGVTTIDGQPPPTSSTSPHDPLLAIMPEFAFSMPAQIVVAGVDLALVTILTIQLIFTNRYHYPLSKRNYGLQLTSTLMLLVSLSVHLHSVLSQLSTQSHSWPYMFEYIAVQTPPQDGSWNTTQEAFYLLMRAITAFFIHLTHIQFLTLLFPSALEARLILWMLGPLALAASGMEFTALSSDADVKTSDLGDAIRNICNSTLFLLYGCGILLWGLMVNRRRAWRTDGGTAAFGGGAVSLAAMNTMISFVEIAYDRLWWLPDICWTLTVWQSWLGFWWWVGSGMGIGEVEDRVERQQRKLKRLEKARRKKEREERGRLKVLNEGAIGAGSAAVAAAAHLGGNSSDAIKGGFRRIRQRLHTASVRRTDTETSNDGDAMSPRGITEDTNDRLPDGTLQSIAIDSGANEDNQTVAGSGSHSSDTNPTTSGPGGAASSQEGWLGSIAGFWDAHQPNFIRRRMRRLRLAHVAAARRAATEQTALRDQVLSRQTAPQGPGLRTMVLENRNAPVNPSMDEHRQSNSAPVSRRQSAANGTVDMARARAVFMARHEEQDQSARETRSRGNSKREVMQEAEKGGDSQSTSNGDGSSDGNDDAASNLADNGDAAEGVSTLANARSEHPSQEQSWTFRGGLRNLRMRDHTTYD